jgi:hypothetical protein
MKTSHRPRFFDLIALAFVGILLLTAFLFVGAPGALGSSIALTNITPDLAFHSVPSVAVSLNGDVVVSWQQTAFQYGRTPDVYASVAIGGGAFSVPVNISNNATPSRDSFLFRDNQSDVYMLYRDTLGGMANYKVMETVWNGTSWSAPVRATNDSFMDSQDPAGVQSTDGTIWFVRQVWEGGTWTDAVIQPIGSNFTNLSNDGSAVKRPAIAAGDNNTLYAAWVDHNNERKRVTPGMHVVEWDGTSWTNLPSPNQEVNGSFPALAYHGGLLYLLWRSNKRTVSVKEMAWDGTNWSPVTVVASGSGITYPRIAVPQSGNVFVAWEKSGAVYLQENSSSPIPVSAAVPNSHQPALFVDDTDTAHVVFSNGDIWYAKVSMP